MKVVLDVSDDTVVIGVTCVSNDGEGTTSASSFTFDTRKYNYIRYDKIKTSEGAYDCNWSADYRIGEVE